MSFLSVDGTAIVQLLNFAIFFAILNVVFMRPVARAIAKRREYINSVTADYDRYQAEGAALRTQAEAIRAAARREAEHALAAARAQVSNEAAAISTDYGRQASELVQQAERQVEKELEAARASSAPLVGELAGSILARALPEIA
ncbi:MAG TPA: hypothetical protein VGR69_03815 [Candidatus Rubrimentiphilum sp.]|nr:hypothetical protein [Candidatus Rubrimentiphilum sp.]